MEKVLALMFALALTVSISSFVIAQGSKDRDKDKKADKMDKPDKKASKKKAARKEKKTAKKDSMKKDDLPKQAVFFLFRFLSPASPRGGFLLGGFWRSSSQRKNVLEFDSLEIIPRARARQNLSRT